MLQGLTSTNPPPPKKKKKKMKNYLSLNMPWFINGSCSCFHHVFGLALILLFFSSFIPSPFFFSVALSTSSPTVNFIKCPTKALLWENRKHRSLEEILTYNPDIIALEEVDHYDDFYLPSLKALGYSGEFLAKKDSPCLKFSNNSGPDGCALFYDEQRFTLEERKDIFLQGLEGDTTNQIALLTLLHEKSRDMSLCCIVTHLKAKAGNEALRLAQGQYLLGVVQEFLANKPEKVPVVICGDFNAEPSEPVYKHFEDESGFTLRSASVSAFGREPVFTTWKVRPGMEVKHTIDYVWHTADLAVPGFVSFPEECHVSEGRYPCLEYPSDHLSLIFDLSVTWENGVLIGLRNDSSIHIDHRAQRSYFACFVMQTLYIDLHEGCTNTWRLPHNNNITAQAREDTCCTKTHFSFRMMLWFCGTHHVRQRSPQVAVWSGRLAPLT